MRSALALVTLLVVLAACSRREPVAYEASPRDASPAPSSVVDAAAADLPPPPREVEAKGTVRFVLQHVEAVCIVGLGANGKGHFTVGTDLLLETDDESGAKPSREHVFCPNKLSDGGATTPRLDIWRNCRRDPTCKIVNTDGGGDSVEVVCGKDHVSLDTASGKTILRGPSGQRELAPTRMKVAPPKSERRNAMVDC